MKIPFNKLPIRLTGISTLLAGLQWEYHSNEKPRYTEWDTERNAATRLLTYFEDRRILYAPLNQEMPDYGIESILQIRQRLIAELEQLSGSRLYEAVAAMRAACRKFLDDTQHLRFKSKGYRPAYAEHFDLMAFFSALDSLRATFGMYIGLLAAYYEIDIEEELSSILPTEP